MAGCNLLKGGSAHSSPPTPLLLPTLSVETQGSYGPPRSFPLALSSATSVSSLMKRPSPHPAPRWAMLVFCLGLQICFPITARLCCSPVPPSCYARSLSLGLPIFSAGFPFPFITLSRAYKGAQQRRKNTFGTTLSPFICWSS